MMEPWSDRWTLWQDQREATDSYWACRAADWWKHRQRSPPADEASVLMDAALLHFLGIFWHGTKQMCYVRITRAARTK